MYYRLSMEIDALDIVTGRFYYNDKSPIFLTVNQFEATALTDDELKEVKDSIANRVEILLDLFTDKNGFFVKRAKLAAVSPEYRIPLMIMSTTIGNIISMGIKKDTEPCESSYILELTKLNNYWLKEEQSFDVLSILKEVIFKKADTMSQ